MPVYQEMQINVVFFKILQSEQINTKVPFLSSNYKLHFIRRDFLSRNWRLVGWEIGLVGEAPFAAESSFMGDHYCPRRVSSKRDSW